MKTISLVRVLFAAMLLAGVSPTLPAQTISYMLPDIGSPGMNTLVEFIAPHDAFGNFGSDGLYLNNPGDALRLRCADANDTGLVVIGPFMVSWDGRLVSAQVFVRPDADPPSSNWQSVGAQFQVPIEFVRNGTPGNSEMFYVVRPQPAIVKSGDGLLGSGGTWGLRSPRGAMIVDSMVLRGSSYGVSTADCDAGTPGNQGYLPVTIISRGPVRMESSATLSLDAMGKHAGPGGGGGGGNFCDFTGDGTDGGDGFTGGGRGGRNRAGNPFGSDEYRNPGTGSGPPVGSTGGSLNGVPGGNSPAYEASGGGTGHPFGSSGEGCISGSGCNPPGGYGGGSGQQQTLAGGGGGYSTEGFSTKNGNGGKVHGNDAIIPLAGGSGAGGGNPQLGFACSGDGGGGGGALKLSAPVMEAKLFTAYGAPGANAASGDGGSGSGGAIHLGSKLSSSAIQPRAGGGFGPGGFGGAGRIRMDGPITVPPPGLAVVESMFTGPSTDTSQYVPRSFTLTGTGNGEDIHLFMKSEREPWTEIAVISGYGSNWSHSITLPPVEGYYYLAALQSFPTPSSDPWVARPAYVPSQSAANIFIFRPVPAIAADPARSLPGIRCEDSSIDTVTVGNTGEGMLRIPDARFLGGSSGFTLLQPTVFPIDIAPGETRSFVVRYDRVPGSRGVQRDTLQILSNSPGASPYNIVFSVDVDVASFAFDESVLAFPDLLLCEGTSVDTSVVLTNTGTVPLLLLQPTLDNSSFTLLQPAPAAFPLSLPPDSSLRVQLRVTHTGTGSLAGLLEVRTDANGCSLNRQVILSANARDAVLTATDLAPFPTLRCAGEFADTTLILRNDGDVPVTVTALTSSLPAFQVLSPAVPVTLGVGQQVSVRLRFVPSFAGAFQGLLTVESMPCAQLLTRVLDGRRDSLGLRADAVDFGVRRAATLPVTETTVLRNTGSIPVTVTAAAFAPPFRVSAGLPVTLQPGDSTEIVLQFDDNGMDGPYAGRIALEHAPSCDSVFVDVQGRRATARVVLRTDTVVAAPSDVIELPIYLSNAENLQLFGATSITVDLRYSASVMSPLFAAGGILVGDDRVITLDLPFITDENDVALRLPFMVTLGLQDESVLWLERAEAVGGELTIEVEHGRIMLTEICREGGDRFFDGSASVALRPNRPNPFNPVTELSFDIIEAARTQLLVFDMLGRRVVTLVDDVLQPGSYTRSFDGSRLPSGMYIAVLKTATVTKTRRMLLAK
ncbi:MAG: choice-of-anchor D domain-containing protein [Bacteroidota bacterium]|nr:choice-of-anchor D domain-containing protein [Bacteroidota bacterium]